MEKTGRMMAVLFWLNDFVIIHVVNWTAVCWIAFALGLE